MEGLGENGRIISKLIFKEQDVASWTLKSSGSGQRQMAGFYGHGNEPSVPIQDRQFLL